MEVLEGSMEPGKQIFYKMWNANGTMYGRTAYLAFERPHRVRYTQQFCDEHGNIARHPMAPTWPATMLTTVDLTAEGPDRTRVTVTWEPGEGASREEIETFVKARTGMTMGWTGSFDKLEELIVATADAVSAQ
jgi:uncharacterized protein YndB with AHSA1/START domain